MSACMECILPVLHYCDVVLLQIIHASQTSPLICCCAIKADINHSTLPTPLVFSARIHLVRARACALPRIKIKPIYASPMIPSTLTVADSPSPSTIVTPGPPLFPRSSPRNHQAAQIASTSSEVVNVPISSLCKCLTTLALRGQSGPCEAPSTNTTVLVGTKECLECGHLDPVVLLRHTLLRFPSPIGPCRWRRFEVCQRRLV